MPSLLLTARTNLDLQDDYMKTIPIDQFSTSRKEEKKMARGNETTWDINPEDLKKAIAQDKYNDCFACRVTGKLSSHEKGEITFEQNLTCFAQRHVGPSWTGRMELLFWNEKSPVTRTKYPKERIKVPDGVETSRCGNYIGNPYWNGSLASTSLSIAFYIPLLYRYYRDSFRTGKTEFTECTYFQPARRTRLVKKVSVHEPWVSKLIQCYL